MIIISRICSRNQKSDFMKGEQQWELRHITHIHLPEET